MAVIGKKIAWRELKHYWTLYVFVIPTLILLALFQYYPAMSGIFHSLFRWNGADISEWVGFENYLGIFRNKSFWQSFEVAFTIGIWNVVKMFPALLVAVCLNRVRSEKMQFIYRVLFVMQMVIPGLIIVIIWRTFFFETTNGYLNRFLFSTGLYDVLVWADQFFHLGGIFKPEQAPAWLGDPRLLIVACIVWGFPWVGSFAILNYLARLQNIPKDIYEAAEVDGVSFFSKFTKIEFPLITESFRIQLVLVIIETIKDAGMVLVLAGIYGGPGGVVTVPALFMLRKAFIEQDMGYACAIGIILTVIVFALQKLSNMVSSWSTFSIRKRMILQMCGLAAGILILLSGHFIAVGCAFLIASFPYWIFAELFGRIRNWLVREKEYHAEMPSEAVLLLHRIEGVLLCILKHATILFMLLLAFLPIFLMAIVSGKDNNQFYLSPLSLTLPFHWENWAKAWNLIEASLANSMFISISATGITLFTALAASYFFARHKMPFSTFFWNAIIVLMMMPAIANMIPLFRLLQDMSLLNTLTALIIVGAAGGQVFAIFVLRSFIEDIPRDLFEAAEIDGANHFMQMMIIVLPLAGPILGTIGVMQFITQWNDFILPLIIMRDQEKLPVMVQMMRIDGDYIKLWGPLMASYALASIPVVVLFIFSMRLFSKGMTEGGVKG